MPAIALMRACVSFSAASRAGIGDGRGLHADQRGDQRQRIADAVVHLAQQHLRAVARLADVLLGGRRLALRASPARPRLSRAECRSSRNSSPVSFGT